MTETINAGEADDEPPLHPDRADDTPCPQVGRTDGDALLDECWALGPHVEPASEDRFRVLEPRGASIISVPTRPAEANTLTHKRRQLRRMGVPVHEDS